MNSSEAKKRTTSDSGVSRPPMSVLADDSVVPPAHLVQPPPNHFTHVLSVDEPYRFDTTTNGSSDGYLAGGAPVLLVSEDGAKARVIDERGLYVEVRKASLRTNA
jgi:hypothetical protein